MKHHTHEKAGPVGIARQCKDECQTAAGIPVLGFMGIDFQRSVFSDNAEKAGRLGKTVKPGDAATPRLNFQV